MTENAKQPEEAKKSPGKGFIRGAVNFVPNAFKSFGKGLAAFKETFSKDEGKKEKLPRFLAALQAGLTGAYEEWQKLGIEKTAASKEAKDMVDKSIDEKMGVVMEGIGLPAGSPDQAAVKEFAGLFVRGFESVDKNIQAHAYDGLKKILKNSDKNEDEAEKLTMEEAKGFYAGVVLSMKELRAKYPEKSNFKNALEKMEVATRGARLPFKKLLALAIYKPDKNFGLALLSKLGLSLNDIIGKLGLEIGDLMSGNIAGLIASKKNQIINLISENKNKFLPNTPRNQIEELVDVIIRNFGQTEISIDDITKLAFAIDLKDYDKLAEFLTGSHASAMA